MRPRIHVVDRRGQIVVAWALRRIRHSRFGFIPISQMQARDIQGKLSHHLTAFVPCTIQKRQAACALAAGVSPALAGWTAVGPILRSDANLFPHLVSRRGLTQGGKAASAPPQVVKSGFSEAYRRVS